MKPIIFSALMARRIADGAKINTRRPIKPQPTGWNPAKGAKPNVWYWCVNGDMDWSEERKSRYQVGDRLWVREPWRIYGEFQNDTAYCYESDWEQGGRWKPAMFMPRNAARLFLDVITVRPERLLDITEADARAEGFVDRDTFLAFWDTLYAKKPQLQAAKNPWVWVYGFKQV